MIPVQSKNTTLADFLDLPERKPDLEYINGQISKKTIPKGKHSTLQTELVFTLNSVLKRQRIAWAFTELRCTFGNKSIVPDIAVFTWERIPCDENGEVADNFYLAPNWTIEILSPEQSQTKVIKNILYCLNDQTEMGWLIDPQERSIFVYQSQRSPEIFDQEESVLLLPSFAKEIQLTVGEILGWLIKS
jgi:Uma2 family endonuclease